MGEAWLGRPSVRQVHYREDEAVRIETVERETLSESVLASQGLKTLIKKLSERLGLCEGFSAHSLDSDDGKMCAVELGRRSSTGVDTTPRSVGIRLGD